jgi:hypothetical protein
MKRQTTCVLSAAVLVLAALLALSACTDPVFYTVSQEVRSRDARIKGTPTNIVEFNNYMYVASNALFRYQNDGWATEVSPAGKKINQIAAVEDYLYALCSSGSGYGSFTLHRLGKTVGVNDSWEEVNAVALSGYLLFSIYADGDRLFAGAWNGNGESNSPADYALFHDNNGTLELLRRGTGNLSGVAYYNDGAGTERYFLATGYGIYWTGEPPTADSTELVQESAGGNFPGIIQLKPDGQTVAINRRGYFYTIISPNPSSPSLSSPLGPVGALATGALATYKSAPSDPDPVLLLVGIQGDSGSSNYGYREIKLVSGALPAPITPSLPGSAAPSSIIDGNAGRYESTLGHRPVNYLHQATVDSGMTLFAATITDGLFSYRARNGVWQWNAEE